MNGEFATSEKRLTGLIDELTKAISESEEGEVTTSWSELRDLEIMNLVLLQREASRLSERLGEDRPRARPDFRSSLDRIKDLEVEDEISRIRVPTVEAGKALVHGRITNEDLCGVDVEVALEDSQGATLMKAETDRSGYYAFVVDPEVLPKEGATLCVLDKKGEAVLREPKPIKVAAGESALVEIALSSEELSAIRPTPERVPEDEKAKRRRPPAARRRAPKSPGVASINGIGPKRAATLSKAGIADVKAFLAADEKVLRELLGNVNIRAMKTDARKRL